MISSIISFFRLLPELISIWKLLEKLISQGVDFADKRAKLKQFEEAAKLAHDKKDTSKLEELFRPKR